MKTNNNTETLKANLDAATEKAAEMAKSFAESSAKQFEATLNAGKALFENITKHSHETNIEKQAAHIKDTMEHSFNTGAKWFEESSKVITGLFDKQYKFMVDSYSNFMSNAFEGVKNGHAAEAVTGTFHNRVDLFLKNIQESSNVIKKMFSSIIDNLTDESEKGFVKEISDIMQDTYSKQTEQLLKFNKNLLDANNLQNTIKLNKEISDKLQKDLEKNFEASKKIIKSISDSYTKENTFTTKSGKKMLDEIFAEIDVVTKNNMKFWNNWFDETYSETTTANKTKAKTTTTAKNGHKA